MKIVSENRFSGKTYFYTNNCLQDRAEKTLSELYGGQYKLRDARSYKDSGGRLDRRFWVRDNKARISTCLS